MTGVIPTASATVAGRIAQFVETLSAEDIPAAVQANAKLHALDALGIGVASSDMDFGRAIHQAGCDTGTGEESRTLGFGTHLPAAAAALVNGTLMHGLDFDDTHIGAIYHATAPALATALAVGEAQHAGGEAVLTAYVIGLEVGCRLAAAGAGQFHAHGFHPTAIAGAFAATCVAGRLYGLSLDALNDALGLCGSQAAGILEVEGSWLKRLHPGWAAHSGIIAAYLGRAGFHGPATVFEGRRGVFATHLGEIPAAEDFGLEDLGERWMSPEIAFKPYPCCHFTHAFADATFEVLKELRRDRLRADDVAHVECPITPAMKASVTEPVDAKIAPKTIYGALFSVQYVVASALLTGVVDLATFYDKPLDDPETLDLARKVSCPDDPSSDYPHHFPGEVAVELADGTTVRRRVSSSYGTPDNAMSAEDVTAKFLTNAQRVLPEAQARTVAGLMAEIELERDVSTLVAECSRPQGERAPTAHASL